VGAPRITPATSATARAAKKNSQEYMCQVGSSLNAFGSLRVRAMAYRLAPDRMANV